MRSTNANLLRVFGSCLVSVFAAFADATASGQPAAERRPEATSPPSAVSSDQLQRLEQAVEELRRQNEQLRQRVEQLEREKAQAQTPPALTAPVPTDSPALSSSSETTTRSKPRFVIPLGKESRLALGGVLQAQGEFGDGASFEGRFANGPNEISDRIRLRRARVNVSGDFLEQFDFKLEGDFQQGDGLSGNRTGFSGTDLFLNWHAIPEANLQAGQYKAPFGFEQLLSNTRLLTIERSLVTSALTPQRQVGIQIWGRPLERLLADHKGLLSYACGIFNGNGRTTVVNDNDQFMYVGRIELTPFSGRLRDLETRWRVAFNGLHSRDDANINLSPAGNLRIQPDGSLLAFSTHSPDERRAWGVDHTLSIGPFELTAEYLEERIRPTTSSPNFSRFTAHGYYVLGSCSLPGNKFQLVARWDNFNPDQAGADDIHSILGGLNYYINGHDLKLMLNYVHTWSEFRRKNPASGQDEFDTLLMRMQVLF